MSRLFLAAFLALSAWGTSAAAQTTAQSDLKRPTLRSEAIISGDIVRIGDLIEHAGIVAKVPIFRAPDPGYTGTVSADTVLEAVHKHALVGVDTAGVRDVVVTRASRTIDVKEIEDVVARALSSQFDLGPSKDITVKFVREFHAIHVDPSVKGQARVSHINFDVRSGRFDAALEFPTDAGNHNVMRLSGRAIATVEIATVTRTIERGGVIKDADVVIERRARNEAGRDVAARREQVVGLAARNSLQPGRPLRVSDLMKPDMVQRNETVTLIYEVPGIVLTVRGKAAESGSEGNVISVLNEQSKRTVQGVIAGPGRVVVNSGSPRLAANLETRSASNAR